MKKSLIIMSVFMSLFGEQIIIGKVSVKNNLDRDIQFRYSYRNHPDNAYTEASIILKPGETKTDDSDGTCIGACPSGTQVFGMEIPNIFCTVSCPKKSFYVDYNEVKEYVSPYGNVKVEKWVEMIEKVFPKEIWEDLEVEINHPGSLELSIKKMQ